MIRAVLLLAAILASLACHKRPLAANTSGTLAADSSYTDLAPGQRLRILVPLLTPGTSQLGTTPLATEGTTITLSASNLLGYEVFYYAIVGAPRHQVTLKFASAETTRDGKTAPAPQPSAPPFPLPPRRRHVRLLYLIRSSTADHNMALLAARQARTLDSFTARVKAHPESCATAGDLFCAWIPAGIAVRPESAAAGPQME